MIGRFEMFMQKQWIGYRELTVSMLFFAITLVIMLCIFSAIFLGVQSAQIKLLHCKVNF